MELNVIKLKTKLQQLLENFLTTKSEIGLGVYLDKLLTRLREQETRGQSMF